mmetsp:Transcript_10330/g.26241  ORF Transcript_10330/g.26241 Transcript_10330/m.26241 type:complete len:242 (-) Transcript_10330:95-820(-)
MYINMFGCEQFGYLGMEDQCVQPYAWGLLAAIYFVLFTIVGGLVLMTLFIGVVTTSMEEASEEQKEQMGIEQDMLKHKERLGVSDEEIETYRAIFALLDLDGGGSIDEEELALGFANSRDRFSKDEIKRMVAQVDEDNSGEIDISEFVLFMDILKDSVKAKRAQKILVRQRSKKRKTDIENGTEQAVQTALARFRRSSRSDSKVHPAAEDGGAQDGAQLGRLVSSSVLASSTSTLNVETFD